MRRINGYRSTKSLKFQSTHSRGVRRYLYSCQANWKTFQSTHSRGVRRRSRVCFSRRIYFNPRTHEECDFVPFSIDKRLEISIHALTRSATGLVQGTLITIINFNPRTHEECDRTLSVIPSFISYFNPRTHEECDYTAKK